MKKNILAENMLRFGVKNLSESDVTRLTENKNVVLDNVFNNTYESGGRYGYEWGDIPTRTGQVNRRDMIPIHIVLRDDSDAGFEIKDIVFTPNVKGWVEQMQMPAQPIKVGQEPSLAQSLRNKGNTGVSKLDEKRYQLYVALRITNLYEAKNYLTKNSAYGTLSFTITPRSDRSPAKNINSNKTITHKVAILGSSNNNVVLPDTRTGSGSVSRGGGTVTSGNIKN